MKGNEIVKRSYTLSKVSTSEEEKGIVEGHASVFDEKTDIGGFFYEIIERGAFDECDLSDVSLFVNHNQNAIPLARSKNGNGTLELEVDTKGLCIKANLDIKNNSDSQKLHSAIERNDIGGMSFAFRIKEQKWEDLDTEMPTRHILKIAKVSEVSAVTYPAYEGTDIDARSKSDYDNALEVFRKGNKDNGNENDMEIEKMRLEILAKV